MNEEEYEVGYEDEDIEYYAIRPNKTRIKKEISALFDLGEELSELPQSQLNVFELPENIYKAITDVSGMPHKGARKRLLKYIAGQLHKIDVGPIREKMARIKNKSAHAAREHHLAERWRDRLIKEGNEALTEFLYEYTEADGQRLRQLMRNAQKEAEDLKPPKSSRMLYRYLKDIICGGDISQVDDAEMERLS